MTVRVLGGDCRDVLKSLPDESVHCVVTSPPYFGLRDYGTAKWEGGNAACGHAHDRTNGMTASTLGGGKASQQKASVYRECPAGCGARRIDSQIGLEPTPDEFVAALVAVFREVRRVLRDDGTVWLNLGDSYASAGGSGQQGKNGQRADRRFTQESLRHRANSGEAKPKDLIGIPWRVAFALQQDGWYLRQDIIWAKPNPMPESVRDRCTKAHEYIFLLAKSERYYYDADAIAEPSAYFGNDARSGAGNIRYEGKRTEGDASANGQQSFVTINETRNKRSVWTVSTKPFSGAHFATFPPDLIEPCILAGTSAHGCCEKCGAPWAREVERTAMVLDRSERTHELGRTRSSGTMLEPPASKTTGWSASCACAAPVVPCTVLDPFGGAGTTGLVADRHGRNAILIELNHEYAELARKRISGDSPLFAEVA